MAPHYLRVRLCSLVVAFVPASAPCSAHPRASYLEGCSYRDDVAELNIKDGLSLKTQPPKDSRPASHALDAEVEW
jgi:hypothetical protein